VQEQSEARARAARAGRPLVWFARTSETSGGATARDTLVRCLLADRADGEDVVTLPLPVLPAESVSIRRVLLDAVTRRYGAGTTLVVPDDDGPTPPTGSWSAAAERLLSRATSDPGPGVCILFTGLSGSGKSTLARGVRDACVSAGRTVTLLDGDEVRQLLSAGLGFSRADRDLNVQRIGFVAAEVVRHGGIAVAAPIAPYGASRDAVRQRVEEVGHHVLVHVATPLEECERRDRKGLYAAARRGEVTHFTGVDDPYEAPRDADLTIDTTDVPVADAVAAVVELLERRGLLRATPLEG
jgi:sulfate adenylyltransferase